MNWLISVFDLTGNTSRPFRENGWDVSQIDKQGGIDFLLWDWRKEYNGRNYPPMGPLSVGIIAMVPCTHDATSGAKHFKAKDFDGRTIETDILVERLYEMIQFFQAKGVLKFWMVEQPRTRLHNRFPWLKPITQKFNPCDFAGYDPIPDNSRYNKETWLFGDFKKMELKPMTPLSKDNPGWKKLGGKSLKTKNARSITPLGFAYAFYQANK